jgi:hypothetical protein
VTIGGGVHPAPPGRGLRLWEGTWTWAAYAAAIVLYVLIGLLAVRGGLVALRTEAVLQTLLVFLGFNVAWLLLLDDTRPSRPSPHAKAE